MNLAETIKYYRLKAGLTQQELADYLSLTAGAVSNYEKGTRMPGNRTMKKLSEALHIPLSILIEASIRQEKGVGENGLTEDEFVSTPKQLEKECIDTFRRLTVSNKRTGLNNLKKLLQKQTKKGSEQI